ncbi:MAG TPA: SRPBCC family protein [Longimicrobiaceae bacterium]|nr:SRPBCC family protein [Longimicrobiaceae bacterium]
MRLYRLTTAQRLPISVEEAWAFFSDPRNLPKITPPSMGFSVTSELPSRMYAGMIVTYKVRPLLGVPITWVTEITQVNEPYHFVDEQRFGPYRFWHHQHHFGEVEGGVEMRDLVHYALPLGVVGGAVRRWMVGPQLARIFTYRRHILAERFGELPGQSAS